MLFITIFDCTDDLVVLKVRGKFYLGCLNSFHFKSKGVKIIKTIAYFQRENFGQNILPLYSLILRNLAVSFSLEYSRVNLVLSRQKGNRKKKFLFTK